MLSLIKVRNYAIIDEVELELERGFSVMTGETGAGKSILVDALGLALGDRADASTVRSGAERAEIRTGVSDDNWIEVTNLQRPTGSETEHAWTPIDGTENVILGDLSILTEGAEVKVSTSPPDTKKAAVAPPGSPPSPPRPKATP